MIYIFFGKNVTGVREKALSFMQTLAQSDSEVIKITSEAYGAGVLVDLAESVSLFGGAQVVLLDTPSSDAEFNDGVEEHIELLRDSKNHFVIIEGGLLADKKKLYTKHAEYIEEIKSEAIEKFNTFALADALLNRDKKTLWLLLTQAWEAGESNEAIVGILFWQIKVLRLAERTSSPEEAGQKPFPYNKGKRALSKFKKGDVDRLSQELLELYHAGHQGRVDMSVALEKWVLSI